MRILENINLKPAKVLKSAAKGIFYKREIENAYDEARKEKSATAFCAKYRSYGYLRCV